jgi:hypothetical protein
MPNILDTVCKQNENCLQLLIFAYLQIPAEKRDMAIAAVRQIFEGCAAFMQCFQKEPVVMPTSEIINMVLSSSLHANEVQAHTGRHPRAVSGPDSSTRGVGTRGVDDVDPATGLTRLHPPPEHYRRRYE